MSAWREALDAADDVRHRHKLDAGAATTCWLDGIVRGRLGVKVTLPGGRTVAGTPREIGALVARAAYAPRESTASAVLGVLAGAGRPMGGPEIAALAGLSRNTVHRCLASLDAAGRVTGSRRPARRGFGWRIAGEPEAGASPAPGTPAAEDPRAPSAAGQGPAGEACCAPPAGSGGRDLPGDVGTAAGDGDDEALLAEGGDGMPDGGPPGAGHAHEVGLGRHDLAGGELAGEDRVPQDGGGLLPHGDGVAGGHLREGDHPGNLGQRGQPPVTGHERGEPRLPALKRAGSR